MKHGAVREEDSPRDLPFAPLDPGLPGKPLTEDQAAAADVLRGHLRSRKYGTTLLKGVTGSGKTEVYLEAVAECLAMGRQALVLLPEIALTAEFLTRVEARFGAKPAEWHSGATMTERRRIWRMVGQGGAQLVVGARSALFLPFRDLGLIIVDEEHDTSYKQEDGVLYNARDMAVLRAAMAGARVVLASATPSLESWANAEAGKYDRLDLTARFGDAVLPEMRAIDMRAEKLQPGHLDLTQPARCGAGADGRGGAGAAVPQPAGLCAGDDLPGLRPPDRLRSLRRADGRAPVSEATDVPSMRRDQADARGLPLLRGGGAAGPGRPRNRAAGRGDGGAVPRGADRGAEFGPVCQRAGAEGKDRRDRRGRRRHHHRHPSWWPRGTISPS